MKIYIGGKLSDRPRLHDVRRKIWEAGHEVVSTWIDEGGDYSTGFGGDKAAKIGLRDVCQISSADLFILDTTSPLSHDGGGGREFEFGFALGQFQHKQTWRVGPVKNSFHAMVDRAFETWDEAIAVLANSLA
jgi:hypothetical protein